MCVCPCMNMYTLLYASAFICLCVFELSGCIFPFYLTIKMLAGAIPEQTMIYLPKMTNMYTP